MKLKIYFLFLFVHFYIFSQNKVSGRVYNDKKPIENTKIINKTKQIVTYSNRKGDFNIVASLNDSLFFESSSYKIEKTQIDSIKLTERFVIQLKEIINELDEVIITSNPKETKFNVKEFNVDLKNQLILDIERNPHLYRPVNNSSGIDFIQVFRLVRNIFKKEKVKTSMKESKKHISYEDFDILFKKNTFFTEELLAKTLKIDEEYRYLFFDFCEAEKIKPIYLKETNKLSLLNELLRLSKKFLYTIELHKK